MYIFTWALRKEGPGPAEQGLWKLRGRGSTQVPRRRVHTVAGKRQAVLKALGDMYNSEAPQGPLYPRPGLGLTRAGHGGRIQE